MSGSSDDGWRVALTAIFRYLPHFMARTVSPDLQVILLQQKSAATEGDRG